MTAMLQARAPLASGAAQAASPGRAWQDCTADTDRSDWSPKVRRFMEYWLSIAPAGALPGRRQFDPLHIHHLMPHVWMLDVVRGDGAPRFRYRLVGTKEVETLERDVTGKWFDDVHAGRAHKSGTQDRFHHMVDSRVATYRKGRVVLVHHKNHRIVENCMVPLAGDGTNVDIIVACSTLFWEDGTEA